ncbi:MAG TPA: LysR family transcriptional regulator [Burkholderiaceae bacterium]|nr:LysR family transcriptional regulator [Burkholderiaceae bacterium]
MSRLDEISTFVAVVNAGSITRAAEKLGIVKSAVSRRMNDLEDRLKARLLVRSTAGLSVTEAGKAFYERAARIMADLDEAELTVTDASADLFGTIRMSAPVSLTNLVLMPHISQFLRLHPGLTLDLSLSDRFVDIVNEGYDIAIRAGTLSDSRLVARKLTDMGRVTCASPDYLAQRGTPATPQELDLHDGLVSSNAPESVYWNYALPDGGSYLARPAVRLKVNNGEAVITAAAAGLGIAAVPAFISGELIERGALVPLLTGYPLAAGSLFAIYPPGRHLSHRVRVLIDFLVAQFALAPPP